jgi:hypothetical protein
MEKKTLRLLCVLGVSAVSSFLGRFHRRDAEYAEVAQRKAVFPTDSMGLRLPKFVRQQAREICYEKH